MFCAAVAAADAVTLEHSECRQLTARRLSSRGEHNDAVGRLTIVTRSSPLALACANHQSTVGTRLLRTTLDARLVCRTFNACVCDGMERTCHRILQVCRDLRTHEDLACAYEVRKTLTWNGVSSFRAMSELWLAMQRSALTQREAVHLWMRLQFNKPEGAHPPRAPNALQSMVCVHGEALGNGSGYGTRSEGRKRVRFRLGVPDSLVSVLRERGWTESDSPVSGSMCPGV